MLPKLPGDKVSMFLTMDERVVRVVRGNMARGIAPHINYNGERYSNAVLRNGYALVGKEIAIHVNRDDGRSVLAFLSNGAELGYLTAQGQWGRTKHSMLTRKIVLGLKRKREIYYSTHDDPVHVFMNYLNAKAQTSKRARGEAERVRRESKSTANDGKRAPADEPVHAAAHENEIAAPTEHANGDADLGALNLKAFVY